MDKSRFSNKHEYSFQIKTLPRERIELSTFRLLCLDFDYETDALPTALPRQLTERKVRSLNTSATLTVIYMDRYKIKHIGNLAQQKK